MNIFINNKHHSITRHYITIVDLIMLDGIYPNATQFLIKCIRNGKVETIEKDMNDIIELENLDSFNIIPNDRSEYCKNPIMGRNSCIVKEPEELSWDCQSKEDGICTLPIGSCEMCTNQPKIPKTKQP